MVSKGAYPSPRQALRKREVAIPRWAAPWVRLWAILPLGVSTPRKVTQTPALNQVVSYECLNDCPKAKSYKLCHGEGPDDLSFKVSALMLEGWELYGEPFMAAFPAPETDGTAAVYCQALIHASKKA